MAASESQRWDDLTAVQLAELGAGFIARAAERRRVITVKQAWEAFHAAGLSEHWKKSIVPECGRIRGACLHLVGTERLHPEQVAGPMLEAAHQICVHPLVAKEAVAAGIADGLEWRGLDG